MKSFKEYLNEMAIAKIGDWKLSDFEESISELVLSKYWKLEDEINGLKLYHHKASNEWIMGDTKLFPGDDKKRFGIVFRIQFGNMRTLGHKFKIKKLYNVNGVFIPENKRGNRLASFMYHYFITKRGYSILGDEEQYFGARRLWSSLSKQKDLIVDILNLEDYSVIEKDVNISHGDLDHEFDKRVWSYGVDKKHIRLLMKAK